MAIGVIAFLLTPLFYGLWEIDTDLPGLLIVGIGLSILIIGIIRRKRLHGWKLTILVILAITFLLPMLPLIASLIYYLITGKPLGG